MENSYHLPPTEFMELVALREEKLDRLWKEARSHWRLACELDGLDPDRTGTFIVFSEDNPHAEEYGRAIAEWGRIKSSKFIDTTDLVEVKK